MIQMIYASAATVKFTDADLKKLLAIARRNNTKLGISGMLVYQDGTFLQILEGKESTVDLLFKKIERDRRHGKVQLLLKAPIEKRSFGDWKMGFVNATGRVLNEFPGFCDFFRSDQPFGDEQIDRARSVLMKFREGAWQHIANA